MIDKVKQEEDAVWFDKLHENMCIFKHLVQNRLKQEEESLKRESKQSSFGKKSHISRVDLHQKPAGHDLATHQLRKEP